VGCSALMEVRILVGRKNGRMIVIFLVPALFFYLSVFIYPVFRTFIMSFFAVEAIEQPVSEWSFVGLGNYINLFDIDLFNRSVTNYLTLWLVGGIAVLLLGMIYAVILTGKVRLKKFFRAVIYIPNVISAIALGTMWINYVFRDVDGLFDRGAALLGFDTPVMWTGPYLGFWSLLIAYCFGMVGYIMLTFISGIEKISDEYYECASIEGANIFQQFFFITLPLIKGVIRSNIVIWTVSLGTGVFAWSFMFSPNNLTLPFTMPPNYMREIIFGGRGSALIQRDSGAAAAVGILIALLVLVISLLSGLITRKDDIEM